MNETGLHIHLNGAQHQAPSACSLLRLLHETKFWRAEGIAVSVNGRVIPRGEWEHCALGAGDEVEVVTAVAGGL